MPTTSDSIAWLRWSEDQAQFTRNLAAWLGTAPSGTVADVGDGELIVSTRGWPKAQVDAVPVDVITSGDADALFAALGPAETITLTGDGGPYVEGWHRCDYRGADGEIPGVRVQRYSARGVEFHGWLCPGCRQLIQTG